MKNIRKQDEPTFVSDFNRANPYDGKSHRTHWDDFRSAEGYQEEVVDRLLDDQGNLCAYCEIDIHRRDGYGGIQDIGIEHFHPKSSYAESIPWVTRWSNLFAVCLGGSNPSVHDPDVRYGAPDLTCDKKKGDLILDGLILNPLDIPPFHGLFAVGRTSGVLTVSQESCERAGIDPKVVERTIVELNLNAERLLKARKQYLETVSNQLLLEVGKGKSMAEALQDVARSRLLRQANGYGRFFTACRAYLGSTAEAVLASQ